MLAACFALSFALYLQNETHRRVGLAADAAPEPEILPDHRLLPAERLEFAGRQEGCRYLLGGDSLYHQSTNRHPACAHGRRCGLDALDSHQALTSKASAPVDRVGGISVAAGEPEAGRNSPAYAVEFATIGIGTIAHCLSNSFEVAPTIARIDRCCRSAQRVEIFIRQPEHRAPRSKFEDGGGERNPARGKGTPPTPPPSPPFECSFILIAASPEFTGRTRLRAQQNPRSQPGRNCGALEVRRPPAAAGLGLLDARVTLDGRAGDVSALATSPHNRNGHSEPLPPGCRTPRANEPKPFSRPAVFATHSTYKRRTANSRKGSSVVPADRELIADRAIRGRNARLAGDLDDDRRGIHFAAAHETLHIPHDGRTGKIRGSERDLRIVAHAHFRNQQLRRPVASRDSRWSHNGRGVDDRCAEIQSDRFDRVIPTLRLGDSRGIPESPVT